MTTSAPLCPACGRSLPLETLDRVEKYRDEIDGRDYELIRCSACRVVFTEPRVPASPDWYARAYALGFIERAPVDAEGWRLRVFRSNRLPAGRLFDVGCGDGGFLKAASDLGFKASGFDFDPNATAKARALGLDAATGDFDSFFADARLHGAFDVVTLFDVVEHVPEPAALLTRAKKLVKAGGHMVVTMPDERRPHFGERERLDYPPNHFTRWRPEALRSFLERHGLKVLMMTSAPIDARYLSGQAFYGFLMPLCLPWLKHFIPSRTPSSPVSNSSEVSSSVPSADQGLRARLVEASFLLFRALSFPFAWPASLGYRLTGCGNTLYALVRVPSGR
ncbi:MAG: class I SAM-dependent methyltransferase [Elusimicrobiota bacterium]